MKHFGDITQLSGYDLPVVDVITGGSPCQDLSVAGARAGLAGDRSGLFYEQVRIIKEMREKDVQSGRPDYMARPRYLVFENVPGLFSSNKGADFQTALTEIVRIAEPDSPSVPMPEGKWPKSGCLYSEVGNWSIAWRLHDGQFWGTTQYVDGRMLTPGTPQRRKRVSLVADFNGLSAPEILFIRKGLSRNPEQSSEEREGTACGTEAGTDCTISIHDKATRYRGGGAGRHDDGGGNGLGIGVGHPSPALSTSEHHAVFRTE